MMLWLTRYDLRAQPQPRTLLALGFRIDGAGAGAGRRYTLISLPPSWRVVILKDAPHCLLFLFVLVLTSALFSVSTCDAALAIALAALFLLVVDRPYYTYRATTPSIPHTIRTTQPRNFASSVNHKTRPFRNSCSSRLSNTQNAFPRTARPFCGRQRHALLMGQMHGQGLLQMACHSHHHNGLPHRPLSRHVRGTLYLLRGRMRVLLL
jgi:hypothetical protein